MATLKTVPTQKKYGLQIRGGSSSGGHGNVKKSSTPAAFFRSALEEDDEEEEEEKEEDNSRGSRYGNKSANKLQSQKVIQRANKEIMQNSSNISLDSLTEEERQIYDYDASYDDFKSKEQEKFGKSMNLLGKNEPPKSRYISKLQATALVREKEKDRIYEKILLKERQQEDAEFGDKPKFITSEYKRKLMEDQKWEIEDKIADEIEQRTSVTSRGMHGFYANLLTKNIAMGSDVTESAVSAYTAGSRRQQLRLGDEMPLEAIDTSTRPSDASQVLEEPKKRINESTEVQQDEKRMKIEPSLIEPQTPVAVENKSAVIPPQLPTPTPPPPPPAISKEEVILSAKERYLQRKKLQQQQPVSISENE